MIKWLELMIYLSDEELATRYKGGDEEAFNEIYNRYSPVVFKWAMRHLDNDLVEDAAQETFLKVIENFAKYDASRRFASWFFGIMDKEVLNLWKRHKKEFYKRGYKRTSDVNLVFLPSGRNFLDEVVSDETMSILMSVGTLRQRAIMKRQYLFGESVKEIANVLETSVDSVDKQRRTFIRDAKVRFLRHFKE